MHKSYEEDEIIIDFVKIIKILDYRKKAILKVFIIAFAVFILSSLLLPKKYETSAHLYIDKSNNTNLAELNPYIIASASKMGGNFNFTRDGTSFQNEIELMKSPLVMDYVIKENNLRYTKGRRKGELISTKSFLESSISISHKNDTNIIVVSYKSKDPKLNYNIINSIIKNYQLVNEQINTQKTSKDKKLLENSYLEAINNLNSKLSKLKDTDTSAPSSLNGLGALSILKGHDKALGEVLGNLQNQAIDSQKSKIEIDQNIETLKLVKTKLEWTNLVEEIAKSTTNVMVIKKPDLKNKYENSEPQLLINFIFIIIIAIFTTLATLLIQENKDEKLSYGLLKDKVIYNIENNLDDLKLLLLTHKDLKSLIIVMEGFDKSLFKELESFKNVEIVDANINTNFINKVSNSDKIILAGKIGKTPKKTYLQTKITCVELQKNICLELV